MQLGYIAEISAILSNCRWWSKLLGPSKRALLVIIQLQMTCVNMTSNSLSALFLHKWGCGKAQYSLAWICAEICCIQPRYALLISEYTVYNMTARGQHVHFRGMNKFLIHYSQLTYVAMALVKCISDFIDVELN